MSSLMQLQRTNEVPRGGGDDDDEVQFNCTNDEEDASHTNPPSSTFTSALGPGQCLPVLLVACNVRHCRFFFLQPLLSAHPAALVHAQQAQAHLVWQMPVLLTTVRCNIPTPTTMMCAAQASCITYICMHFVEQGVHTAGQRCDHAIASLQKPRTKQMQVRHQSISSL